jgi:hypothetical protein
MRCLHRARARRILDTVVGIVLRCILSDGMLPRYERRAITNPIASST